MKLISSLLLLIAPITLALPTSVITEAAIEDAAVEARQTTTCYVKCGSTCYTSAKITAARNSGYNYYAQGGEAGGSTYPHTYNNYEGFRFLVAGPYQEFPLLASGTYAGGSPGADRVIFNTAGQRAGEITHTGASGSGFVKCTGW